MKIKYNKKNLKLKDIIALFDPIVDVVIWTQDCDDETPAWSGSFLEIPWIYLNGFLGSEDEKADEPIRISPDLGAEFNHRSGLIINLIVP